MTNAERAGAGVGDYTFITPNEAYELTVEERDDPYDTFCVTTTSCNGYDEWSSGSDLRDALGVAVMRIVRHETGDNCMCHACRNESSAS